MLSVYKYPLGIKDLIQIDMPKGAEILRFGNQGEVPTIWALIDLSNTYPDAQRVRTFRLAGTGHPIDQQHNELKYIGTDFFHNSALVFHLFEVLD